MPGNKIGGLKAAAKNKARDPDFYKKAGTKGGSVSGIRKGFATNPELASRAGALGGAKSRRRKKVTDEDQTGQED